MSKKTKAFVFNLIGFAIFYTATYALLLTFGGLIGLWIAVTSAVVSTILAPKFQAIDTNNGQKLFMKWIFKKEVIEIK